MIQNAPKPTFTKPAPLPEFLRIEVDGVAGVGKTHFLGTIGKGNKLLLLDLEGGSVTFSSPAYLNDPDATEPDNIDVVRFDDINAEAMAPGPAANELVHRIESAFDYLISTKNSDGYTAVALDSLTEFQQRFLSFHKETVGDPRQSYGALADTLYGLIIKARNVPAHVVFTSRPKLVRDEVLNKDIVRSDISPKAWTVISGLIDAVGHYTANAQGVRTIRALDFSNGQRFQGKQRYGLDRVTDPTMVKLLEVAQQNQTPTPTTKPAATPVKPRPIPRRAPQTKAAAQQPKE